MFYWKEKIFCRMLVSGYMTIDIDLIVFFFYYGSQVELVTNTLQNVYLCPHTGLNSPLKVSLFDWQFCFHYLRLLSFAGPHVWVISAGVSSTLHWSSLHWPSLDCPCASRAWTLVGSISFLKIKQLFLHQNKMFFSCELITSVSFSTHSFLQTNPLWQLQPIT